MHNNLIEAVRKYISLLHAAEAVYLFGSVLNANKMPNDIDILIIYLEYTTTIHHQAKEFTEKIENATGLAVDLTILSAEEEKEVRFLERIDSLRLK